MAGNQLFNFKHEIQKTAIKKGLNNCPIPFIRINFLSTLLFTSFRS
jgi:hypothetical protein